MTNDTTESGSDQAPLPGPGAGFTFLYYFSMTIVIVLLTGSQGSGLPISSVTLYRYGIALGVVAGGIGTYFNRTDSFEISGKNSAALKSQIEQVLSELGLELDAARTEMIDDYTVYRRSGLSKLFSGAVFVAHRDGSTQIVSRVSMLRKLQQRL